MQIHRYSQSLPIFRRSVITIGTFDGVHSGHNQIIGQLKAAAKEVDGETVIITFHPHPRRVVGGQQNALRLLNTLSERIELLEKSGIDHLVIVPFTEDFAQQLAIDYIENFLISHFAPHTIIIGYDHRFGRNREGNYQLLEALKEKHGYRILEISEKILHNVTISSTRVRQALLNGSVCEANEFLGYPYFLQGEVVEGKKLGRTIGYPTANIRLNDEEKLVPANGVYAVKACLITKEGPNVPQFDGMMNIGVRPTVDGTSRTIEVNIFNFDREIYGETLRVYFFKRLRGEVRFDGLEALKNQLAKDKEESSRIMKELALELPL
jgi:riboflavin kinase / FMN adenylyltransferase